MTKMSLLPLVTRCAKLIQFCSLMVKLGCREEGESDSCLAKERSREGCVCVHRKACAQGKTRQ